MDWIEVLVVCWALLLIVYIVTDTLGVRVKVRYWLWCCVTVVMGGVALELELYTDPECRKNGGVPLRSVASSYQCYDRTTLQVLALPSTVRVPTYPR